MAEELKPPFRWIGMGYRDNGDGYGRIKNDETGQTFRIGAMEACWRPKIETYKQASIRAFNRRMEREG